MAVDPTKEAHRELYNAMKTTDYMDTEQRAKMRRAAPLLGEPGAAVALSLLDQVDTLESENARLKEEAKCEAWKYFILELARRLCHLPVTDFPAQRLILADMRRIFSEYDTEGSK